MKKKHRPGRPFQPPLDPPARGERFDARVRELGRLLAETDDLSKVDDYFHDHLAPLPVLYRCGQAAEHRPLVALVQAAARAYGFEGLEAFEPLNRITPLSFWHGALRSPGGAIAIALYFDDRHLGFASLCHLADVMVHRFRFTLPEEVRDPRVDLGPMELQAFGVRGPGGRGRC